MFTDESNNCGCGCKPGNNMKQKEIGPFIAIDAGSLTPLTAGAASRIPFSSGNNPSSLFTNAGGLPTDGTLLGFGSSRAVGLTGASIDLTTALGTEAFSISQAGNITSISASYTVMNAFLTAGTVTIRAQIYRATAGSNIFNPTNAFVDLAPLTTIVIGTITNATVNLAPVPVAAGDLLLMVFSASATGIGSLQNNIAGNASAGITIA